MTITFFIMSAKAGQRRPCASSSSMMRWYAISWRLVGGNGAQIFEDLVACSMAAHRWPVEDLGGALWKEVYTKPR